MCAVLGTPQFLPFINDLINAVIADDCLLYKLVKTDDDARRLHKDLNALKQLGSKWQMNLNRRFERQFNYMLHGHILEVINSGKYLGAHLTNDHIWHEHVDATAAKASKTLAVLGQSLSECTMQVKSAAYTSLMIPDP